MGLFKLTEMPCVPPHMEKRIVHRADEAYPFLHDTAIACLGGKLLMAWYNCTENEITGVTVIRGRWSGDHGRTWSEPELIAESPDHSRHMVPVIFSEKDGQIWAYVTEMTSHDCPTGYACFRYEKGRWEAKEQRNTPVLLNTLPQLAPDGRWIASGRMAAVSGGKPVIPVLAASRPANPADWSFTPLCDAQTGARLIIPETALLVDEQEYVAFIRNESGPAQAVVSPDRGITWSEAEDCGLPAAPSKMYGGTLPDGRQYLLFNDLTRAHDRSRLVLALRGKGSRFFTRAWLLADGYDDSLNAGPYWHYPCACIEADTLHISCTVSGPGDNPARHAALFSIPLRAL